MLVECGYTLLVASDGSEFTFSPSFKRIASIGSPRQIVEIYAGLHGKDAASDAAYVLLKLCEQDDVHRVIGSCPVADDGFATKQHQIEIAQHLMCHGIIGKAKPEAGDGKYSEEFHAEEYISAACVHLGIAKSDAEQLSMTEFQIMFEMKFPNSTKKKDIATREEYHAARDAYRKFEERRRG